jgi:hypothetical protein
MAYRAGRFPGTEEGKEMRMATTPDTLDIDQEISDYLAAQEAYDYARMCLITNVAAIIRAWSRAGMPAEEQAERLRFAQLPEELLGHILDHAGQAEEPA